MASTEKSAVLVIAKEAEAKQTARAITTLSLLTLSLIGVYVILHSFVL